jgi:hypothetical protein
MKKFYASKTFWFNVVAFVLAVGIPVAGQYGYTGELPPELGVFVIPAIALINLILRFVTKEPIA